MECNDFLRLKDSYSFDYQLVAPRFPETSYSIHDQITHLENSVAKWLEPIKSILVIVNDATRSTKTAIILDYILPFLHDRKVTFIVATGTHRQPNESELKQIFGKYLQQIKPQLIFHDAHYSEMIHLGKTRFGNDVFVNQVITQADGIITINSVEPHYFAGFTGGRKSILPGIAGYKTIEYNHRLALKKGVGNAMLQGNPVHLDMEEGVSMIQIPIFSIQLVQDWTDKICFLSFGDIRYSFYQAVEVARNIFTIKIDTKADIVIAEVESPLNRNLYQAHKALENCRSLLKQGGIFILMASCHEGIGNARFVETLNAYDKLSDVMKNCELNYKLGDHKAFRIASFLQHSKLLLVSEMNENVLQHSSFENYPDLQTAMQNALKHSTNNPRVIHVKQAGTISVLAE